MDKAVFLDRDGTINVDKDYLYKIDEFEYLDGVREALRLFSKAGYKIIIITNQSGIARGYYTQEDYTKLESWMKDDLEQSGVKVTAVYYCPHHPQAKIEKYRMECKCRKPAIGMYEQAIREHDIDINGSVVIGDKERDVDICKIDKYKSMRGYKLYSEEARSVDNISFIKGGLLEAAHMMLGE